MAVIGVEWVSVPLRLILGAIFIVHGYPKLFKDFKKVAGWLASEGFKPGAFWAFVLGATEFFGGVAILVGVASRVAAGLLIISMSTALLMGIFKWKKPFTKAPEAGWEFDAIILAGLITLFLLGSGMLSADQLIGWMLG